MRELARFLQEEYYVVLMDFPAQLRDYYINGDAQSTFQSVILAGVYAIDLEKHKNKTVIPV